jgi:hypothetical protein
VRTKSQLMTMLGMPSMDGADAGGEDTGATEQKPADAPPPDQPKKKPSKLDMLKGILGR